MQRRDEEGWATSLPAPPQRALSHARSVNYFASTPWELARDGFKRCILHTLHLLGLYKAGNCVCHAAGAS